MAAEDAKTLAAAFAALWRKNLVLLTVDPPRRDPAADDRS